MLNHERTWHDLAQPLDLLVIGGGVTGAAILWEATRRGLRAALVERSDFASGTSSRSSKLIHGGLRYLREGQLALVRESLREREALLACAPGLVEPLPFLMPVRRRERSLRATVALGLTIYDALARAHPRHRWLDARETAARLPDLDARDLLGAYLYYDATVDDARLVLRLIGAAHADGAVAANYVDAHPLRDARGHVIGARLSDRRGDRTLDVRARVTIAAAGVFTDALRAELGEGPALRPLRGSHLILPDWRLPLASAVAFAHPHDGRPVFAYPWQGRTLVGTTDLDHRPALDAEPAIAAEELAYLLAGVQARFPGAAIRAADVVATFAGVRPVIDRRRASPSHAARDYALWNAHGLIAIAGGKLTTFRPMALAALRAAAPHLPPIDLRARAPFDPPALPTDPRLPAAVRQRLAGRYGARAAAMLANASDGELQPIAGTPTYWLELRAAARDEAVHHLDDLLLRRTRIGLVLPDGALGELARIRALCTPELDWSATRWDDEIARYRRLHAAAYGVPSCPAI